MNFNDGYAETTPIQTMYSYPIVIQPLTKEIHPFKQVFTCPINRKPWYPNSSGRTVDMHAV